MAAIRHDMLPMLPDLHTTYFFVPCSLFCVIISCCSCYCLSMIDVLKIVRDCMIYIVMSICVFCNEMIDVLDHDSALVRLYWAGNNIYVFHVQPGIFTLQYKLSVLD